MPEADPAWREHRPIGELFPMSKKRKWKVTQGGATATVVAETLALALERARQIGFTSPDSLVLIG